jgi:hypothetical protein
MTKQEIGNGFFAMASGVFGVGSIAAIAIPGWQAFIWLQTGAWGGVPVMLLWRQTGLSPYFTNWLGAQRIIFAILDMPLAWALFAAAAVLAASLAFIGNAMSR